MRHGTDFFKPYPGLSLIQNPKKAKRSGLDAHFRVDPSQSSVDPPPDPSISIDQFREEVQSRLDTMKFPLVHTQRMDPICTLLEAAYYQWLGRRGGVCTSPIQITKRDSSPKTIMTSCVTECVNDLIQQVCEEVESPYDLLDSDTDDPPH